MSQRSAKRRSAQKPKRKSSAGSLPASGQDQDTPTAVLAERSAAEFTWLQGFLNSIRSYAPDESMILESSSVKDLYHYTDLGGLKGIIEGGDLWLTHLRFSNDHEEFTHGKEIVRGVIDARIKNAPSKMAGFLKRLKGLLDQPVADGIYICCFCEKNNLLSQWRGYGANGSGVCIKFEKAKFSHLTGADCQGGLLRLWKVFYPVDQQRKIIEKAIDYAWQQSGATDEEKARRAAEAIQFFIPTFKNPDFAEEQEWRLIFTPAPTLPVKPAFRTGRSMLIPYYGLRSLGWGDKPLPIKGICVGPGTQKDINAQSIQMLLNSRQYNGAAAYPAVCVEVSQIPYRG